MIRGRQLARVFLALGVAAGIAWALTHRQIFDAGVITAALNGLGAWAPAGFIAFYAAGTVLFFSGALLSLAGGALFGPLWGTLWNLLGALLGATISFLIARVIGSDWISRRLGGRLKSVIEGVEAEGWRFVALTRLVPLVPFNLLNYVLGLTRISLPAYVLASMICMLPGAIAYTWLGHAGRSIATGDTSALRYGLFGLGALAMIAFLPRLIRRFRVAEPAWIQVDELHGRLAIGDAFVLIDVRQPEEFRAPPGHLPGAVNIPLDELAGQTREFAGRGIPIVEVCKTDRRSARGAMALSASGVRNVAFLRGGTDGWHRRGLPLE